MSRPLTRSRTRSNSVLGGEIANDTLRQQVEAAKSAQEDDESFRTRRIPTYLFAYGNNDHFQLGVKLRGKQVRPVRVDGFPTKNVWRIACGGAHSCAITYGGEVYVWGSNSAGQLGLGEGTKEESFIPKATCCRALSGKDIVRVALGGEHSTFLGSGGVLWACGRNTSGQVGAGKRADRYYSPIQVDMKFCTVAGPADGVVVRVVCGSRHTVVLTNGGKVATFGANQYGQLGNGTTETKYAPSLVPNTPLNVRWIAAGGDSSGLITQQGTAFTWGRGNRGQLGHGTKENELEPRLVENLPPAKTMTMGFLHTAVLTDDDHYDVYLWGDSGHGRLGNGLLESSCTAEPTRLEWSERKGLDKGRVRAVEAGGDHTFLLSDEAMFSFGKNDDGQCGLADTHDHGEPLSHDWLKDLGRPMTVTKVSCGDDFTLLLAYYDEEFAEVVSRMEEQELNDLDRSIHRLEKTHSEIAAEKQLFGRLSGEPPLSNPEPGPSRPEVVVGARQFPRKRKSADRDGPYARI